MSVWWIVSFLCGSLVFAALLGLIFMGIKEQRARKRLLKKGEHTHGWLVQANSRLFGKGFIDDPGLIVIAPDRNVNDNVEFMGDLAERIMALKGYDPDQVKDQGESTVAALMADETYVRGRRDLLPKSFTQGKMVYLVHIFLYREDLPGRKLGLSPRIPCVIDWDDPSGLVCTRAVTEKERSMYVVEIDDDEDED